MKRFTLEWITPIKNTLLRHWLMKLLYICNPKLNTRTEADTPILEWLSWMQFDCNS